MEELNFPNKVNTEGTPALLGVPSLETIGAVETLVITFQPHKKDRDRWCGKFLVDIRGAIATGGQPVVFRTAGITGYVPLYLYSGLQATAANLLTTTGGVIECFFNLDTDRLQLLGATA